MTAPAVLLTLDEARDLLGSRAIALVESVDCAPGRLGRLLTGQGTTHGLPSPARAAVRAYRDALHRVREAGHGWVLDEQVEGALSYAERLRDHRHEALAA